MPTKKERKPLYKLPEFWVPVITGLAAGASVALNYGLGLDLPAEYIAAGAFAVLGLILGIDFGKDKNAHD